MGNKYDDIEKLLELKKKGTITEEEFEKEKKIILGETPQNTPNKVNTKVKQKMKPWQIIIMILLIIVARIYNICFYRGTYPK